jgi:predicted alpha-1,2-mannosidase
MKSLPLLLSLFALSASAQDRGASVNLFTGTSNSRWMMFPGPTLPFGLVKLSPDNQTNVWNGGYEYTVGSVSGFSHLHAMSLSGLSLMPVVGDLHPEPRLYRVYPGSPDGPFGAMWTSGYRSRIRKETEQASIGYYSADLVDYNVKAELTATMRAGMLRLTFPQSDQAHLLIDFAFPAEEFNQIREVVVQQTGPAELSGFVRQHNQYVSEYTVHFVVQLDKPIETMDSWRRGEPKVGMYGDWSTPVTYEKAIREFQGKDRCGIVLNFKTADREVVRIRTGLSLVSLDGARRNLESEMKPFGWDFDAVVKQARKAWEPILDRIDVSGGSPADQQMFYTCLYRSYSAKSVIQDADGAYRDVCSKERKLSDPGAAFYSSDGLWGTQWDLTPLWTLISPKLASSWIHFFLEAADNGGWIPEAPVNGGYSPIMGAQHQNALIVSAYQKGIRDFDAEKAFRAIRHDLTTQGQTHACGGFAGNRHMQAYMDSGYVPEETGAASNTLEYAFDDYAAAQFARALGKQDDYLYFLKRSQNYRNIINPKTKWAQRRRKDGTWVEPFNLFQFGTEGGWNGPGFMEGNPWLYTWFVPQDVRGLVELLGADEFNRRLEEGFEKHYVDLSNQPNLQAPFLFNYSGKPWFTQKYSRQVLRELYNTSPLSGWIGEEDEGQLSALYVLMAMGLFEMDGGCSVDPYYDLTSPLFDRVTLHLDPDYYGGHTFAIEAHGNSEKNVYIQSARLNGKPLQRAWIYHSEIVAGGKLEFEMGPNPNTSWASRPQDAPPSHSQP